MMNDSLTVLESVWEFWSVDPYSNATEETR